MAKDKKVLQYKNVKTGKFGIIIFAVILLYITMCIIISSKKEAIKGYQVKTGTLSENRQYKAVALREENIVNSNYSGYISYFIKEGDRAAYNNLVYCIDETGKFSSLVSKAPTEDNSLSHSDLKSMKQDIMLFSKSFDSFSFSSCDPFTEKINKNLSLIENRRILENLNDINNSHNNDIINYCRAPKSGICLFYCDGFENKSPIDLNIEDFDEENYSRTEILNDDLVEEGTFVYKYVSDENWSLAIWVDSTEASRLLSEEYLEVKFLKTLDTSWAKVSKVKEEDEKTLLLLEFTNSMIAFCKDRFVDIELLLEADNGLKVPNSSITEKPFFLIDKEYVVYDEQSSKYKVLKREYNDTGEFTNSITVNVYEENDEVYYIDTADIEYGSVLLKPNAPVLDDQTNTFIVGKRGTLTGVYNINKGYAEFNKIEILYENDEYAIINPLSMYGLKTYDFIALDASIVSDKDFVY